MSKCGFEMTTSIYKSSNLPSRELNILTRKRKQLLLKKNHSVSDHLSLLIHFRCFTCESSHFAFLRALHYCTQHNRSIDLWAGRMKTTIPITYWQMYYFLVYTVYAEITTVESNIKSLFGHLEGLAFHIGSLIKNSFGYTMLHKVIEICSIKRQKGLLHYLVGPTLYHKWL